MNANEFNALCVSPHMNLREAMERMDSTARGILLVVDSEGHLMRTLTDGDLRRMLSKEENIHEVKARDIMSAFPKTIHQDALAVEALAMMRQFSITQLIATDGEGLYAGMVHLHDLLKEGIV